jgi:Ser/Thr protein kinase RdoA (MazF antagonist)
VPLVGGVANAGLVVRVGDTVRRPQTAASRGVHALLVHLEERAFDGAPRYLGEDDAGREILSFVHGDAANHPVPAWALTDAALASVADLLGRFHDAAKDFRPDGYEWAQVVPERFRRGIVGHNDPNLDNVVFRDGRAVAFIDFDLAGPSSRVWDVAVAARLWAPLRDPSDAVEAREGDPLTRLRRFVDRTELDADDRALVVDAVLATHDWCYDVVDRGAARGQGGYAEYWTGAARIRADRGRRWLHDNEQALREALS